MKKQLSPAVIVVVLLVVLIIVALVGWQVLAARKTGTTGVNPDAQQGVQDMMKQGGQLSGQGSGAPTTAGDPRVPPVEEPK